MPRALMKSGEFREVRDDEMLSFLQENQDRIQDRYSPRKRRILRPELLENIENNTNNTK